MRKLTKIDIPAWYPVFNNSLLGFSAKDKNVILKKFYDINGADKMETKCLYFRQCLDLFIVFLLRDKVSADKLNTMHLIDKINLVEKYIPDFISIRKEFHVIRAITNKYIHGNGNRPKEDRGTLYFIMSKIQRWFLSYGENLKYQIKKSQKISSSKKQVSDTKNHNLFFFLAGIIVAVILVYLVLKFMR